MNDGRSTPSPGPGVPTVRVALALVAAATLEIALEATTGPYRPTRELLGGRVRYLPTAALLWVVLAWAGRSRRPGVAGERGPVPPPEAPATSADAPRAGTSAGPVDASPIPGALPLPGLNRIRLAPVASIRYLVADGDHVRVHAVDRVHRVRGTLSGLERKRAPTGTFVRIHRSHLVNLAHVREVQPPQHGDYVAVMGDGAELRIPRTRRRALARILGRTEPA